MGKYQVSKILFEWVDRGFKGLDKGSAGLIGFLYTYLGKYLLNNFHERM